MVFAPDERESSNFQFAIFSCIRWQNKHMAWKSLHYTLSIIQTVFFAPLFMLMIYATFFDFNRIWTTRATFEEQSEIRLILYSDK
jgi:hypothetical protein